MAVSPPLKESKCVLTGRIPTQIIAVPKIRTRSVAHPKPCCECSCQYGADWRALDNRSLPRSGNPRRLLSDVSAVPKTCRYGNCKFKYRSKFKCTARLPLSKLIGILLFQEDKTLRCTLPTAVHGRFNVRHGLW